MIAPWRDANSTACGRDPRLREAHKYLAASICTEPREDSGPAVAAWKAWLFVGWMVLATALWATSMLGWW
jgi:hypothetical protein